MNSALKTAILDVAASLNSDRLYKKEDAVKDLIKIADDFFDR